MNANTDRIINNFFENNFKPMPNIPGNKIFVTDNTVSTLVWVEQNVVIEHYTLFPNLITPIHYHPFHVKGVFMFGDMISQIASEEEVFTYTYKDSDIGKLGPLLPAFKGHGFKIGERGAILYNIQIWPDNVTNPVSAAIEYKGQSMGPLHDELIRQQDLDKLTFRNLRG